MDRYYKKRFVPLALPALILFVMVIVIPFIMGVIYSFTAWRGTYFAGGDHFWEAFVGFDNYVKAFKTKKFLDAFVYTIKVTLVAVVAINVVSLAMALLATSLNKGAAAYRTIYFLPNLLGGLALGYIWQFIFEIVFSKILFGEDGIISIPALCNMTQDNTKALFALVMLITWQMAGYMMIIYTTGLNNIPKDLSEAAAIDGAGTWQRFKSITVPMLMPSFTIVFFLTLSKCFMLLDQNVALTDGNFSFFIGNVEIEKTAALAPMASVADKSYRLMCKEYGASYLVSEMISSKGLCFGDKKTARLCEIEKEERPYALQLFGEDPYYMGKAAYKLNDYSPDIIDINMGCPVPKIVGNGSGSALMKLPDTAAEICREVVKNANCPVTVKFRAGWDENSINAVEFAKLIEQAGASAVTCHGRTRTQFYSGKADWDIIKQVKANVKIPVIGNGDVVDGESAKAMYEQTVCDLVMIGRGSYGRPWVFRDVKHYLETGEKLPEVSIEEKMAVMKKHCELICKYKGERQGMKEARKNCAWYVKGLKGSARLRAQCGGLNTISDLYEMIDHILANELGE